jgi:hypothetical protein
MENTCIASYEALSNDLPPASEIIRRHRRYDLDFQFDVPLIITADGVPFVPIPKESDIFCCEQGDLTGSTFYTGLVDDLNPESCAWIDLFCRRPRPSICCNVFWLPKI